MNYTIAVIENIHSRRKISLMANGNKRYLIIEEDGECYITGLYSENVAGIAFEELCRFTYQSLYSFEDLCKMY